MEKQPVYFRPTEEDWKVIQRIAAEYPVFAKKPTELLRIALGAYLADRKERERLAALVELLFSRLERTEE